MVSVFDFSRNTETLGAETASPKAGDVTAIHVSPADTKAFSSKLLVIKVSPRELTDKAVTNVVVLSASRKEDVPAHFTRLP